jgi:hypothetical protein
MNVRSVTVFVDVGYPLAQDAVRRAGDVVANARQRIEQTGIAVQTTRLATQPIAHFLAGSTPVQAADFAAELEEVAEQSDLKYIALGPVRLTDPAGVISLIPAILKGTANVACSIEVAHLAAGLSLPRLREAANVILEASALITGGFANFRLAVLANVRPWSPFFPAAYHGGGAPRVALGIEGADLAVDAVRGATSLAAARGSLVAEIEQVARRLENAVTAALETTDCTFQGIDFSWASYPEAARSIGTALEALGLVRFGQSGSLAAAAFLTDILDRARFTRTGFCGLMLPVLEDSVLAMRAAEGSLSLTELLALSAVCGTGLDTIPLPGDISAGQIAAILADVAVLALRLDKQLTARLMPIPGKKAGDLTTFDSEYCANSRVLAGPDDALTGLLAGQELLEIKPRSPQALRSGEGEI